MNLLKLLFLPFLAHATITPVTPTVYHSANLPILEKSMVYENEDIPIEKNALIALEPLKMPLESEIPPFSTSTLIKELWGKQAPIMEKVFFCESHGRQWDENGKVIVSGTSDVGYAQLNLPVWGEKAKELGYDVYQTEGNLRMAKVVYDTQSLTAWTCSRILGIVN